MRELTTTVVAEDELRQVHGGIGLPTYREILVVSERSAHAAILPIRVADRLIDIDI